MLYNNPVVESLQAL